MAFGNWARTKPKHILAASKCLQLQLRIKLASLGGRGQYRDRLRPEFAAGACNRKPAGRSATPSRSSRPSTIEGRAGKEKATLGKAWRFRAQANRRSSARSSVAAALGEQLLCDRPGASAIGKTYSCKGRRGTHRRRQSSMSDASPRVAEVIPARILLRVLPSANYDNWRSLDSKAWQVRGYSPKT